MGVVSAVFVPFFFLPSIYTKESRSESAMSASLIRYFFLGFVILAQIGGRSLDRPGARPAVVLGTALSAAGFSRDARGVGPSIPVMAAAPLAALVLPLKILVWADGPQTKVSYTAPEALAARYQIRPELAAPLAVVGAVADAVIQR